MKLNIFLQNIENIYMNVSIYRSIIIANDDSEAIKILNTLLNYNHNAIYIKDINYNENYINTDYRVFIITKEFFYDFVNYIDETSYNFIAISFNINDTICDNILKLFLKISNNNVNNVMISNYQNYNYFVNLNNM